MSAMGGFKGVAGRLVREASLTRAVLVRGNQPRAMFFPSSIREGASLLRAYSIAETLVEVGWNTVVVPKQLTLAQRRRLVARFNPDILVFQQCRHALNDAPYTFGKPYVLDIDDADFVDETFRARIVRMLRGARGVIAGSRFIADWCGQYNDTVKVVWTGTPVSVGTRPDHADRPPVIAWAQRAPLRYPFELEFATTFYHRLKATGREFSLRLYGANSPEERAEIRRHFGTDPNLVVFPRLGYDDFLLSLRGVSIGLSPIITEAEFSKGKSFGKILGYLDAKVPVIVSEEADHALFFTPESGVVSNDLDVWVEQAGQMLDSAELRNQMADNAFRAFEGELTIEAAARKVDQFLRSLVEMPPLSELGSNPRPAARPRSPAARSYTDIAQWT